MTALSSRTPWLLASHEAQARAHLISSRCTAHALGDNVCHIDRSTTNARLDTRCRCPILTNVYERHKILPAENGHKSAKKKSEYHAYKHVPHHGVRAYVYRYRSKQQGQSWCVPLFCLHWCALNRATDRIVHIQWNTKLHTWSRSQMSQPPSIRHALSRFEEPTNVPWAVPSFLPIDGAMDVSCELTICSVTAAKLVSDGFNDARP